MDLLLTVLSPVEWAFALSIAVIAGLVKGVVGFAMPMVFISGLSTFIAPELALAALILPTLATNGMQALRQGPRAALGSARRFWVFLLTGSIFLALAAQLVPYLRGQTMLLIIGVPVTIFAILQLRGWQLRLAGQSTRSEVTIGVIAGFLGGISGIWGPPTVAYLTALNTEKREQMRIQGVIYGSGALLLTVAHLVSGVLRIETVPLSLAMIPPAVVGMWLGTKIQDRIDQAVFRRATLVVLLIAGVNLMRRALMG